MNKKQLAALEKVFAAEIDNQLPFQAKAKIYRDLRAARYLDLVQVDFGKEYGFSMIAWGYALTHAGRIAYCESCKDVEDE